MFFNNFIKGSNKIINGKDLKSNKWRKTKSGYREYLVYIRYFLNENIRFILEILLMFYLKFYFNENYILMEIKV